MYSDDILLYKPISHPGDYSGLKTDIDAIQDCISIHLFYIEPPEMQILDLF